MTLPQTIYFQCLDCRDTCAVIVDDMDESINLLIKRYQRSFECTQCASAEVQVSFDRPQHAEGLLPLRRFEEIPATAMKSPSIGAYLLHTRPIRHAIPMQESKVLLTLEDGTCVQVVIESITYQTQTKKRGVVYEQRHSQ